MPAGGRRDRLDVWLSDHLPAKFEDRFLPIDWAIAHWCGGILARGHAPGRTVEFMDAFIAATAEVHNLTLVTCNVADFEPLGVRVLNPWQGS